MLNSGLSFYEWNDAACSIVKQFKTSVNRFSIRKTRPRLFSVFRKKLKKLSHDVVVIYCKFIQTSF